MKEIIKGYWDCPSCGTKDIDGLVDICPNCASGKPPNLKYHLTGKDIVVSERGLEAAGIKKEECDGNHKEWVCAYCNQMNNYADVICKACGGLKKEATMEYGGGNLEHDYITDSPSAPKKDPLKPQSVTAPEKKCNKINWQELRFEGLVIAFAILLAFLFWPVKGRVTVTGFTWSRSIQIEEERTVEESGWDIPPGGRLLYSCEQVRDHLKVIDHYKTVTVQRSRQVFDHDEYTYQDNGNGTFTKSSHPVYRTEYYTDYEQEPVYRYDPVYDTRYYYEIEKFFPVKKYESSGKDKDAYWNDDYLLGERQIDTKRSEKYEVIFNDGEFSKEMKYENGCSMTQETNLSLHEIDLGLYIKWEN